MKIEILFFGILKDIVNTNKIKKEVPAGTKLIKIQEEISAEYPRISKYKNYALAVNETYVDSNYILMDNDVVAFIPPVSGG